MTWLNTKPTKRIYHRWWRAHNREWVNEYWRKYYRENYETRRAYLNEKQREYRQRKHEKVILPPLP